MPHSTRSPGSESCTLEPIAICGMGGVNSAASLWEMLVKKRSGQMDKVPETRFNVDAHYHENLERPGSFNVRGGYFLDDRLENFDPTVFGITPIEAQWLDPQQRKMLEVSYECFESTGLTLESIAGSNTAVFVGSFTSDYQQMSTKEPDFRHNYAATGVDPGIISNRIGHTFDLNGPSFTINTACSSSIYAIHFACHALRARDCDAAIAGGVNLILTVDQHMNTAKLGILSPTSTCHTFDAAADGYGRAEGAGALYLKRLSDAIRNGDPVRGVIRGTAVNTNGKIPGMGITHPSIKGQEQVVRKAYEAAGLDPKNTTYAELHGTGTPVGDPIEVQAIANALNDDRSKSYPLILGAVKPNIGHSEAASGIFAVMKAALMTEKGVIPGVAHFKTLNPNIHESEWNVKVNVNSVPWPLGLPSKRASVSSFGYGGTNGHVIVESAKTLYPGYQHGATKVEADYDHSTEKPLLLSFSAHDKPTLIRNVAAISQVSSPRFAQRAFTVIRQGQETEAFAETAVRYGAAANKPPSVGYLFTGQGAQWIGMATSAMLTFSSFRETIRKLDVVLETLETPSPFRLESVLLGESHTDQMNDAELAQPLCTAIQIALVDLFGEWHIEPCVSIGHSSGEIGAAYAAGLISAPEAILIAFCRGAAVKCHSSTGSMLAVGIGTREVSKLFSQSEDSVVVACENSPTSTTLSGDVEAIRKIQKKLKSEGVFVRELKTGKAYHSPQMAPVSAIYDELLSNALERLGSQDLIWRRAPRRMISSVTGREVSDTYLDPSYWSDNLRNPVQFNTAVTALHSMKDIDHEAGICFVEIGPHSTLSTPFKQICVANEFENFAYIPSFVRGRDDGLQLLSVAGTLFLKDYKVDLQAVNSIELSNRASLCHMRDAPSLLVDLPPYQWNYEKIYWTEPRSSMEQRNLKHARHDLLGTKVSGLSDKHTVWRNFLRHRDVPWLRDHTLGNAAIFPASGYMALAIEALRQRHEASALHFDGATIRDLDIKTALVIPETDIGIEIELHLQRIDQHPSEGKWHKFVVESLTDGSWTTHCEGLIAANVNLIKSDCDYESPVKVSKLTQRVPGKRWYDAFSRVGFDYKGSFQQLHRVKSDHNYNEAAADVLIRDTSGLIPGESRYIIHPATVDACLQLIIISIHAGRHKDIPWGVVPLKVNEVDFWFPEADLGSFGEAIAWTETFETRHFNTHAKLRGKSGNMIMDIKGLRCVAYEAAVPAANSIVTPRQPYMRNSWKPDISTLSFMQLAEYCDSSATDTVRRIADLLDHKYGVANVLLLGQSSRSEEEGLLQCLPTNVSITLGYLQEEQDDFNILPETAEPRISTVLLSEDFSDWASKTTDLILVREDAGQAGLRAETFEKVQKIIKHQGWMIIYTIEQRCEKLTNDASSYGWMISPLPLNSNDCVLLICNNATSTNGATDLSRRLTILYANDETPLGDRLINFLTISGFEVSMKLLRDFDVSTDQQVILSDTVSTVLASGSADAFKAIQVVLCAPVSILLLTQGVREGKSTNAGMLEGLVRVIRSERAASRIALLDYKSNEEESEVSRAILTALRNCATKDSGRDVEYWLHQGVLHVDRIIANDSLNAQISVSSSRHEKRKLTAGSAFMGSIKEDQLVFRADTSYESNVLSDNEITVQVTFSKPLENADAGAFILGTVINAGPNVGSFFIGKEVVAHTRATLCTVVQVSVWAPIPTSVDSKDVLATLAPLYPALNASILAGKLRGQEFLLLLPMSLVSMAAYIRLSRIFNWKLTIVVTNDHDKQICITKFGLKSSSVIQASHVKSIIELMSHATDSPSIVIAHEFSSLERDIWRSVRPLGRFVLNEALTESALDSLPFGRGASFMATRILDLTCEDPGTACELLKVALSLLTNYPELLTIKSTIHDIEMLSPATFYQSEDAVAWYNYETSVIKCEPHVSMYRFSPEATYLLVGCLGGLGRSLTTWMVERGAKHFAFISRSGADRSEAREVIKTIEDAGVSTQIIRADASKYSEVKEVIDMLMTERPIRGVVHAAMVLKDGLFETMSAIDFQAAIIPKLNGVQCLDKAFEGIELDFFVMTSSISATLGNPGQCNYSAANSFLDSLAWQRNVRHQAGTSLVLPMVLDVGVVAENEDIDASLSRKGMYGIDEQEMLRGFEIAMVRSKHQLGQTVPQISDSQIILGLDPSELAKNLASSDSDDIYWYNDARLRRIRVEMEEIARTTRPAQRNGNFQQTLKEALSKGYNVAVEVIAQHVMERASGILMVPAESFEMDGTSVASYGLDSMIGSELRNWLFKEFGLDISFQQLLSPTLTFRKLSVTIAGNMGVQDPEA